MGLGGLGAGGKVESEWWAAGLAGGLARLAGWAVLAGLAGCAPWAKLDGWLGWVAGLGWLPVWAAHGPPSHYAFKTNEIFIIWGRPGPPRPLHRPPQTPLSNSESCIHWFL